MSVLNDRSGSSRASEIAILRQPVVHPDRSVYGYAIRVNVLDGKPRWTFTTLGTPSSAIVTEAGNVYFGSTDGKLYVTTPKGGLFFAAAARGTVTSAPAINANGFMIFSTDKGLVLLGQ